MQRGSSFAEVAIALFLLAALVAGVLPLFLSSSKSNEAAHESARASCLARDRLEELLAVEFRSPRLAAGEHLDDLPTTLPSPQTGGFPSPVANPFRRRYRVLQFAVPADGSVARGAAFTPTRVRAAGVRYDYKRIDVTVEAALRRPELGLLAVRVSAIRANPAPEELLSEGDPDP